MQSSLTPEMKSKWSGIKKAALGSDGGWENGVWVGDKNTMTTTTTSEMNTAIGVVPDGAMGMPQDNEGIGLHGLDSTDDDPAIKILSRSICSMEEVCRSQQLQATLQCFNLSPGDGGEQPHTPIV